MDVPFQNHGFMLSFTPGDPNGNSVPGPFFDASQDLVDLQLTSRGGTNYQARVTTLVGGFTTPIDAEIIGNRIYVIEYSGNQRVWEITFPKTRSSVVITNPAVRTGNLNLPLRELFQDWSTGAEHGVAVFLGDGRGGFQRAPGSPFRTGRGTWRIEVVDVNHGKPDFIADNVKSNDISILLAQ